MSIQKTDDNIQFDIGYDANNKPYVKPNKDREKALSDTGADIIVESVSNAYEKSMKEILKNQDKVVKAAHSIKLTSIFFVKDYLLYLHEERKKYGDDGIKDHPWPLNVRRSQRGQQTDHPCQVTRRKSEYLF